MSVQAVVALLVASAALSACASGAVSRTRSEDAAAREGGARTDSAVVVGDPCELVSCSAGRVCRDGACVLDGSCDGIDCAASESCVPGRGCVPGEADEDHDGFRVRDGDCDDRDLSVHPGAVERCNAVDDDCDGMADEGDPEGGASCTTSMPGPCAEGRGACRAGAVRCTSIAVPGGERCNGVDDDCNGEIDDGIAGAACMTGMSGACNPGHSVCRAGEMVCASDTMSHPETCDGTDEDCDGEVDDGLSGGACDATGATGDCRAGTMRCTSGAWACAAAAPAAEPCTCRDADCDGMTDDGCRVPVYRSYHDGDHLFSRTEGEGDPYGYAREGVGFLLYADASPALGLVALHRFYDLGSHTHLASTSSDPAGCVGSGGCSPEGILGWLAPSPACGSVPLYEAVSPGGDHLYTADGAEAAYVPSLGFSVAMIGHVWR